MKNRKPENVVEFPAQKSDKAKRLSGSRMNARTEEPESVAGTTPRISQHQETGRAEGADSTGTGSHEADSISERAPGMGDPQPVPLRISEILEKYRLRPAESSLDQSQLIEDGAERFADFPSRKTMAAGLQGCGYGKTRVAQMVGASRQAVCRWSNEPLYRAIRAETRNEICTDLIGQVKGFTLNLFQDLESVRQNGPLPVSESRALLKVLMPYLVKVLDWERR
jgi:hypothetical protein